MVAIITNDAAQDLDIKAGDGVYFIFKAKNVVIAVVNGLKLSARNQPKGKVREIIKGSVNSEVKVVINTAVITATITNESVEELGIKEGTEVLAVIKASDIIVGKF
jgi:molybdate transport system regulatory protein